MTDRRTIYVLVIFYLLMILGLAFGLSIVVLP